MYADYVLTLIAPIAIELTSGRSILAQHFIAHENWLWVKDQDGREDAIPYTAIARIRVDNVEVKP